MLNKPGRAVLALATAALVAGCGAENTSGGPKPTSKPTSGNLHGAPSVQNPLDTVVFRKAPCSVLTSDQLQELNMAGVQGKVELDGSLGPTCEWSDRFKGPSDNTISVVFGTNGDGLKYSYSRRGKGVFEYFRELKPIMGYPAVAAGSTAGGTPEEEGNCEVEVGVTNDLSVLTQVTTGDDSPYQGDPCGRARAVATEVVQTLKAGA